MKKGPLGMGCDEWAGRYKIIEEDKVLRCLNLLTIVNKLLTCRNRRILERTKIWDNVKPRKFLLFNMYYKAVYRSITGLLNRPVMVRPKNPRANPRPTPHKQVQVYHNYIKLNLCVLICPCKLMDLEWLSVCDVECGIEV